MGETLRSMDRSTKVKWLLTYLVPIIIWLVPTNAIFTAKIRMFLVITVFAMMLMAFEFFNAYVIGVLLPALYVVSGCADITTVMSPWLGTTVYMVLGAFVLSAILQECGLLQRVAYWMMSKIGSNYMMMLFSIFLTGWVLTMLTFGSSAHIILPPLCLGLCSALGIMGTRASAAVCMACMLGACTSRSFSYPAVTYSIIGGLGKTVLGENFEVSFIDAFLYNWPMLLFAILFLFIVGKWYKNETPLSSRDYFVEKLAEMGPITRNEKINGSILVIIILFLLTNPLHGFEVAYGFMLIPYLVWVLPNLQSASRDGAVKIPWEMAFVMTGCMAIGTTAAGLGFGTIISNYCLPVFQNSGGNVFIVFGALFLLVFVFNFLMTPMAIWALITIPMCEIALQLGMDPLAMIFGLVHTSEMIILPYEYLPYLIVYAFGMMKMTDFVKLNVLRCVLYIPGFLLILVPYWMLIGLV